MPIIVVRNWRSAVAEQFGNQSIHWRLLGEDVAQAVMCDQMHMRKLMLAIQIAAVRAGLHNINRPEQVTVSFDQGRILPEAPVSGGQSIGRVVLEINGLFATEDRQDTAIYKFLVRVAEVVHEVSEGDSVEALLHPFPVPFHKSSVKPMYYLTGPGMNYDIWHKGACLGANISYKDAYELLQEFRRTTVPGDGHAWVSKDHYPRIEYIEFPEFAHNLA